LKLPPHFKTLLIGPSVVLVGGVKLMTATVGDAGDSQKEFGKSRRYDATTLRRYDATTLRRYDATTLHNA